MFKVSRELNKAIEDDNAKAVKVFFIGVEQKVINVAIGALTNIAASKGKVKVLKMLLERGKDSLVKHIYGEAALNLAATNGHIEATEMLMKFTELDSVVKMKQLLDKSIQSGNSDLVQRLVDLGAPVDHNSVSAAVIKGNGPMVKILMNEGCDIRALDLFGQNALDCAARHDGLKEQMLEWEDTLTDADVTRLISGEAIALTVIGSE